MKPNYTNNFQREYSDMGSGCPFDEPIGTPEATTPLQEGKAATPVSALDILKKHCPFKNVTGNREYFEKEILDAMEEYRNQSASTQGRVYVEVDGPTPPDEDGVYFYINKNGEKDCCNYSKALGFFDGTASGHYVPIAKSWIKSWLKPLPSTPAPEVTPAAPVARKEENKTK